MYKNDFYKELHGIVCDYDYILVKCVRTQLNRWTKIYELPLNAMCKVRQSPQQLFYSFYKDIALAELKAYILIEYGLMIHRVTRNLHFYKRRMNLLRNYDELTERALKTLSDVVEKADRVLFRCDPPLQKGNITSNVDEIRFFNLRETLSDVKANKVVTGVRFVKSNRVFHLQIQQGQLLPRGFINASTVEWKPVSSYEIDDLNIQERVDYHALSKRSHALDLDEVMKTDDKTFIVTGVRFRVVDGHLNLQVHLSKFDFLKGELVNSIWHSKENAHNRQQIVLTPPVNSSQPLSKDNQYLEFTLEDNPQKTVPIIDVQEVASDPSVPLAGIGIYYRASGFVAPKIISYDILSYLSVIAN
ncbi:uncharacterized protein LOC127565424 [Drosophila albomicans]|uniref:Uncharacterized protein LOC127565424 n=1 Tax=Drosophila albomicans TaxID=7291 RepID=A0A9C6T179_DROAB|nr:uncharacterized protein LOC127565424 [Drosophila albomicans]